MLKIENFYLNGKWERSQSKDIIKVENPATKEIIAELPAGNEEDVNIAVAGAKKALRAWRNAEPSYRIGFIEKMVEYLEAHADEINETIIDELGAVVKVSKEVHVDAYTLMLKDYIEIAKTMAYVEYEDGYEVHKEPVGLVACLTPWNFPYGQIAKKIMPALILGNTVVLKPSQHTPLTAYYFARAAEYACLPAGVLQLVVGRGAEVGNVLAKHPDVNMISFTGSTKGGIEVSKLGIDSVKRLSLELGGKSPSIILEGADFEVAVRGTLNAVFPNAGQACSSKTRLLIPKAHKEEIEKLIIKVASEYRYGDPRDPQNDFGPLKGKASYDKVVSYIELGKKEGRLLFQGQLPSDRGYFVPPVVFTDIDNKSRIAQEEIFGPVLVVITYDDVEDAIEKANDSIYGLHGMIYGPEEEARRVAKDIQAGQIQINKAGRDHRSPFGGFKQSGLGREGGKYGMEEYIELKTLMLK